MTEWDKVEEVAVGTGVVVEREGEMTADIGLAVRPEAADTAIDLVRAGGAFADSQHTAPAEKDLFGEEGLEE